MALAVAVPSRSFSPSVETSDVTFCSSPSDTDGLRLSIQKQHIYRLTWLTRWPVSGQARGSYGGPRDGWNGWMNEVLARSEDHYSEMVAPLPLPSNGGLSLSLENVGCWLTVPPTERPNYPDAVTEDGRTGE